MTVNILKEPVEGPRWLSPWENPFGVRVFDCAGGNSQLIRWTDDSEIIGEWSRRLTDEGSDLKESMPGNRLDVLCNLAYPQHSKPDDGPLFIPASMTDFWFVYCFGPEMVFYNALERGVIFRARFKLERKSSFEMMRDAVYERKGIESFLTVRSIIADATYIEGDGLHAARFVDFLIKFFLYRRVVPHPIPRSLEEDEEAIIRYTDLHFGERARFATCEDTLSIPWRGKRETEISNIYFH